MQFYIDLVEKLDKFSENCNKKLAYPKEIADKSPLFRYGLTVMDLTILTRIKRYGPLGISSLADLINVKLSMMSKAIERLVAKGLVERFQKEDRRTHFVTLSKKSRIMIDEHGECYQNYVTDRFMSLLDASELAELKKNFELMNSLLTKASACFDIG